MQQSDSNPKRPRGLRASLALAFVVLACAGLLVAASASAFEQVGNFAGIPGVLKGVNSSEWPEDVQLGGVGGMAVNYTGAGGVPAGTLYAAGEHERVVRYNPDGSFSEAWSVSGNPPEIQCGPEGVLAQPICKSLPGGNPQDVDVDVDQTTGDVYVLLTPDAGPGTKRIHVYAPDGSTMIAEFGEVGSVSETISESPGKIHETFVSAGGAIAVNAAGDVYVFDHISSEKRRHRIMEFEPSSPGDYSHYVYAGQSHDFALGASIGSSLHYPANPVVDAAGHVYAGYEDFIAEYDPSSPEAAPLCELSFPTGGIASITVNPLNGEVFFYDSKDRKIHQLRSCDAEGKFVAAGTITFSPSRVSIDGLAYDPLRRFSSGRAAGVLYAGAPSGEGGKVEKGLGEASLGYIFAPPFELPPVVQSESVTGVTAGTAVLGATINPEGSETRYAFQYVTQAQFEANEPSEPFAGAGEVPLSGGVVGEGNTKVSVSASLSGLAPDTSYRYRVTASSNCALEDPEKVCTATGEAASFHTFTSLPAGALPDGRVYEMVSPPQKNGGQVIPADASIGSCGAGCKPGEISGFYPQMSAADGEAVVYRGMPFSAEGGSVEANEYIAHRNATGGWESINLTLALMEGRDGGGYRAFSDDLSVGLFEQPSVALSEEAPAEYSNIYSQPTGDPLVLTPVLRNMPANRPPNNGTTNGEGFSMVYAGASADLSRIFFEANDALTEGVPGIAPAAVDGGPKKFNLYEWTEGRLSLVNVLPGNTETVPGASVGAGASFGSADAHAISDDGSRVFFSTEAGQVYVREAGQVTKEIESEGVPDPGRFVSAAADGSKVLLGNGHLHDLNDEATVDLTRGQGGFQGLTGQSEDLSHIYFVDTKVLTDEEANGHCTTVSDKEVCERATEGEDNLYAWEQGGGTRFVGTLAAGDSGSSNTPDPVVDWSSTPAARTAQASPDGRFLAFLSTVHFTGYDSSGPCGGSGSCPEVFIYDSATGKLKCPSCNPSGEHTLGWNVLRRIKGPSSLPLPKYLSDEGRLFFDSEDSLVPSDTNGGVEDVYEYEPDSVGSCEREGGCVFLISAGTGKYDSNFLAADPDGKNVFFTTADRLSPRDGDEAIDLYDARIEGGISAETETVSSECHGEACQPPVGAPSLTTPGSIVFGGAGNLAPSVKKMTPKKKTKPKAKKRCAAGKQLVHGSCVSKRRRTRRAHRASRRRNRGGVK